MLQLKQSVANDFKVYKFKMEMNFLFVLRIDTPFQQHLNRDGLEDVFKSDLTIECCSALLATDIKQYKLLLEIVIRGIQMAPVNQGGV